MLKRRILAGVVAASAAQLVPIVVQLLLVPVLIGHWGVAKYGLWLLLFTIPSYLAISDAGVGKAALSDLMVRIAKGDIAGTQRTFHSVIATVAGLVLVIAGVLLIGLFLVPDSALPSAGVTAAEVRLAVLLVTAYGAAALAHALLACGFQPAGHFATQAWSWAAASLFEGVAALSAAISGVDIVGLALTYLLCRSISFAGSAWIMQRLAPWATLTLAGANIADVRRLLAPATANLAVPLGNAVILQGTALALGLGAGPAAVPAFSVARTLARLSTQATWTVGRAVTPEFALAQAQGNSALGARLFGLIVVWGLVVGIPYSAAFFLLGDKVIGWWTHGTVVPGGLMLALMAVSILGSNLWNPVGDLLVVTNRQKVLSLSLLILSALGVATSYLLSPLIGSAAGALGLALVDAGMAMTLGLFVLHSIFTPRQLGGAIESLWRESQAMPRRLAQFGRRAP
ncbi:lipopolysaccharide biosynthesis protein [Sphingomonas sp. GlSt437]|uniref:lipopolysaccharide biosynthesis protein n=1 Tax=Sphingomonas sp. GlSt437 TaxID=3389970 RepID=UPI003A87062E